LEVECDADLDEDFEDETDEELEAEELKVAVPEVWGTGGTV